MARVPTGRVARAGDGGPRRAAAAGAGRPSRARARRPPAASVPRRGAGAPRRAALGDAERVDVPPLWLDGGRPRHRRARGRPPAAGRALAAFLQRGNGAAVHPAPPGDHLPPPARVGVRSRPRGAAAGLRVHSPPAALGGAAADAHRRPAARHRLPRHALRRPLRVRAPLGGEPPQRHLQGPSRGGARLRPPLGAGVHPGGVRRPPRPAHAGQARRSGGARPAGLRPRQRHHPRRHRRARHRSSRSATR